MEELKSKAKKVSAAGILLTILLGLVNEARTAIVDNTKAINEIAKKSSVNEAKIESIHEHYKDIKSDIKDIKRFLLRGAK